MKCSITIVDPRLFAKDLEKIPHTERLQILSTLEDFATQWLPYAKAKRLINFPTADYRLRIGSYRLLFDYSIENHTILVYRVLHRSHSYRS